jgi:hypothetical protein
VKISIGKHRKQYSLLFMDTYTASKNVEVQVEREHHIIEVLIHKEHGGMKREFLPSFLPPPPSFPLSFLSSRNTFIQESTGSLPKKGKKHIKPEC